MKKFTLLAVVAMLAGSAFAQTELNGIKISEGTDAANYHFYRIRNMRAMRLDYTNGVLKNINGDSVNRDGGGFYMSETLPDGVTPTPKIADNAYMGLSQLGGNWWLSFAPKGINDADGDPIKDERTEFWYFTQPRGCGQGQLMINNAVMDGSVATDAKKAVDVMYYDRSNMDFNSKKNNFYYVLPVKPAFAVMDTKDETVSWTDSILKHLEEKDFNMAFAFSLKDTISNEPDYRNQCLDMNNYVNVKVREVMMDENGDTITNANGTPKYYIYGFAGVDRTWSPVTTTSNKNHWENNGSLFFVEPATTADAMKAIEEYKEKIAEGFRKGAIEAAKGHFASTVNSIMGWRNLPALFSEDAMDKLKNIQTWCENWNGEGVDLESVHNPDTRDAYVAAVQKMAADKLHEAAALIGHGCKVTFQNQLALRDHNTLINEIDEIPETFQLGNAYIAAGGDPSFKTGGKVNYISEDDAFEDYLNMGIEPRLEADDDCVWELIPVEGTETFLLYNESTGTYIRKYHDMFTYYGGADMLLVAADQVQEYSWATTSNKNDAAPFTFIGCAAPETQESLTEEQEELLIAADLDIEIENKARLQARYSISEKNPSSGEWETFDYVYNIHRASLGSEYRFVNWGNTHRNWYADSNAFKIESVAMGSINEIAADKAVKSTGIYDLQGRRVSKAGKGIYIVNGVKTFVR